jgi:hypothetical protein
MRYKKYFLIFTSLSVLLFNNIVNARANELYQYYVPTLAPKIAATKSIRDDLQSVLGEGWSTDNDAPVGECLLGTVNYVGSPSGSVSMDTVFSYDDVMNQLNNKLDGNFSLPGFKLKASTDYSYMLKDSQYSQTFIYRASILLKNRHFELSPDKSPLTWIGQQYAADPVAFRAYCGDKFIAEQQIGGALYVAVKFLFHTVQEKSDFNSALQASFFSLASLSSNLTKAVQTVKSSGHVAVIAFQIGGDPLKLGQILGAAAGSQQAPLLDCELNNLDACKQVINQVLAYASQSGSDNFPAQFAHDDPQSPTGPGVIQNILQNYAAVVPIKVGPSLVTQEIMDARTRLSKLYEKSIQQANEIYAMVDNNIPLSPDYAEKLVALKSNVENNNDLLSKAGVSCYEDDLSRCLSAEKATQEKLLPIDLEPLTKRIRIIAGQEDYLFPYSTQQYIYAVGNQFMRDQIFTVDALGPTALTLVLPNISIKASSQNQGVSYQGLYQNSATGYMEKMILIPDFKVIH